MRNSGGESSAAPMSRQRQQPLYDDDWMTSSLKLIVILLIGHTSHLGRAHGFLSHLRHHDYLCVGWNKSHSGVVGNCTHYHRDGVFQCYGDGPSHLTSTTDLPIGGTVEHVIFCGWPLPLFNPVNDLNRFPNITSLTIAFSELQEITTDFPEAYHSIQSINISWTSLCRISSRAFKHLYRLEVLDLRWNQITHLDGPLMEPRSLQKLFLYGNPWDCSRSFKWLLLSPRSKHVVDRTELTCADRKYKDRRILTLMSYKMQLKSECQSHVELQNCTCTMHHIILKTHLPLYTVNCSGLQLQRLPPYLPQNTTTLYVNDNTITDVLPLRDNIHYRNVVDVHLDNNRIESIDVLEGSYWLEHFRLLSLRGNNLRKISVYALDNALDENTNANVLLLSGNPWICSCSFTMRFKDILMKYNAILRDSWNVTCTHRPLGEAAQRAKVLSITRHDVCEANDMNAGIYYLDVVNAVLGSLLLFILVRLAYDYYNYKNYGRVPWIVMKVL